MTRCRVHERVPAIAKCPSCGAQACLLCWHVAAARCDLCLAKDPGGDAAEVPWETADRAGFLKTLAGALRPQSTAAAFGRPRGVRRATLFFLATFVPSIAFVSAIELTRTVEFGNLSVRVLGHATGVQIAADVVHAIGVGLGVGLAGLLAVALPYASLSRAYGRSPHATQAAFRVLLYRAWVLPAMLAIFTFIALCTPAAAAELVGNLLPVSLVIGFVELTLSLRSGARDAAVIGPGMSWVVVVVPLALLLTLLQLGGPFLGSLVPQPAEHAPQSRSLRDRS